MVKAACRLTFNTKSGGTKSDLKMKDSYKSEGVYVLNSPALDRHERSNGPGALARAVALQRLKSCACGAFHCLTIVLVL